MGKVVSVWSPCKKTGKTVFLYMLINRLSDILAKEQQMLGVCINLSYGNLMNLFDVDRNEYNIEEIVNFRLHPANRLDVLNTLAKRKNVYLVGSRKTSSTYINRNMKIFENLLEEFKQTFDLVLFDTISGFENPLTNMVLERSDHILNILYQDRESLDKQAFTTRKDLFYVVNRYAEIYPDRNELSSLYGLQKIFTLPACIQLQEMKNKGRLEYYSHYDTEYNRCINQIAAYLAEKLALKLDTKLTPQNNKRSFLAGLMEGVAKLS